MAGNPVACSAAPTGEEHLSPATDFLLFDRFSAFPEVLGLFANFFFAFLRPYRLPFSVVCRFVFCPGKLMVPSGNSVIVRFHKSSES